MLSVATCRARHALDERADSRTFASCPADRLTQAASRNPRLAELAEQIRRLQGRGLRPLPPCSSGLAALDAALGGGFARGAIHELLALGGSAAAYSVALRTAARAAKQHGWLFYIDTTGDFYPPGGAQLGVPLERLVVIRTRSQADALWVGEQSLRCPAVAAVVLPIRALDTRASRRLQLAAEMGGSLGLLVCRAAGRGPTFAASRLRLDPRVGTVRVGRLLVSILKLRAGSPPEPFVLELPDGAGVAPAPPLEAGRTQQRGTGSAG